MTQYAHLVLAAGEQLCVSRISQGEGANRRCWVLTGCISSLEEETLKMLCSRQNHWKDISQIRKKRGKSHYIDINNALIYLLRDIFGFSHIKSIITHWHWSAGVSSIIFEHFCKLLIIYLVSCQWGWRRWCWSARSRGCQWSDRCRGGAAPCSHRLWTLSRLHSSLQVTSSTPRWQQRAASRAPQEPSTR